MVERADVEAAIRAACEAARWSEAATTALLHYGDELAGYLTAIARDDGVAAEAFAMLAEDLWRGLPTFRWQATFRTWAYGLARHALARYRRDAFRRRATPLDDAPYAALVAKLRSQTATYLRTETKDRVARLRAELDADDQTLLVLRVNRKLGWREIARVFADDADEAVTTAELDKRAAALRKRFERIKATLRARATDG